MLTGIRNILAPTVFGLALLACAPSVPAGPPGLSPINRAELVELRTRDKFRTDLLSGYMGTDLPQDAAPLNAAVDRLIDAILSRSDGPVTESDIRPLVEKATAEVDPFATEDRERAYYHFRKVWLLLGLAGDPLEQS